MASLTAPAPTLDPSAAASVDLRVTLYTRALCCCCQTAREVLAEYADRHPGLVVEEVDATGPEIEARIGPTVPVIAVDGRVRFRGEVNRVLMDRLIAARAARV